MENSKGKESENDKPTPPKKIAISSKRENDKQKIQTKSGEGELVVLEDAWDEPKWCFVADTIEETIFQNRKDAGKAITELTADLITDDVLTVRVVSRQCNLTIEFSFDYNNIVHEQVTAWYKEEDVLERYLRRLQKKKGPWWQKNKRLGGYEK